MSSRSERFSLSVAEERDCGEIQKVFDEVEFGGNISVKFSRAPDPYQSLQNDGDAVIIPVVRDNATGGIIGVGGCVLRTEYISGRPRTVGYLTGMKVLSAYRGKMPFIRQAYNLIRERSRHLDPLYYTTILKSNTKAIALLEKARKGMPFYRYAGEYTVFCLGTGRRTKQKSPYEFQKGNTSGLDDFYAEHLPDYNFAPQNRKLYGLTESDFYVLRGKNGEILAACALWNQQSYKQYIITGYGGIYKILKNLPTRLLNYPALPKENMAANYAGITLFIVKDNNTETARRFLKMVTADCGQYDFLMLGLFENHPLHKVLEAMRHVKYQSRLYTVEFGDPQKPDERPVMLEVGRL